MTGRSERPSPEAVLAGLKDFQRATVEHAFRRLWTDPDAGSRFLVADEVGLGKTLVAKGLIAKAVEHLSGSGRRLTIVYICSNSQIARQNLSRLNVVDGAVHQHADRLSLLPTALNDLRAHEVNFVSFTPGTSFSHGWAQGRSDERCLLYWLLTLVWGQDATRSRRWLKFFRGRTGLRRFEEKVDQFDRNSLDADTVATFATTVAAATGPSGRPLRQELEECAAQFTYLRGEPPIALARKRDVLVRTLRAMVARSAVDQLEPDLVILDEFQRFKDLLGSDGPSAELASAVFNRPGTKVLLLSATPYKMYTLPDEPEGDDHYRDFTSTIEFLGGPERARRVERNLRTLRHALISGGDRALALAARDEIQRDLSAVMSRTERLATTPDRDGMLVERELPNIALTAADLHAWRTLSEIAHVVESKYDVFEFWRSTPYPLNLMERGHYQVRRLMDAAVEHNAAELARALASARGRLDWAEVQQYQALDPGNAKMRGLVGDVLDRGAWRLLWVPPSLPYYELRGAYGEEALRTFTKRLIFSAWAVVPKAIATVVSYEAERRAVAAEGDAGRRYDDRPITPPLQLRLAEGRPAGMPALAISYPSTVLARLGDPLELTRRGGAVPGDRRQWVEQVRGRVRKALRPLTAGVTGVIDQRWYWAAPFLLDRRDAPEATEAFLDSLRRSVSRDPDQQPSAFNLHAELAAKFDGEDLGAPPEDLAEVLTAMAIAGPGVCALRALSRVCGGPSVLADPTVRQQAFAIAGGFRAMVNRPEVIPLVRAQHTGAYWRQVLEHGVDGCLQAVLDEYAHVLVEAEGLQEAEPARRASAIAEVMVEALTLRSSANVIEQWSTDGRTVSREEHRINAHLAARFGVRTADEAVDRDVRVRTAYNSPFRPFVLASTSVGQEGLDFHTYSHAIVHWNLPGNPVDLEQREGRVHRYKGHAVRKNVASVYRADVAAGESDDPWAVLFDAAVRDRPEGESDLSPFWVFAPPGGAKIERYVPALPLSREVQRFRRLMRTVGAYRMVMGQPRQDDLLRYAGESGADLDWLRIDLSPPR